MRYLGLDLGTKSLGLSLSDKTGLIASFYKNISYTDENKLIEEIKDIVEKEHVEKLVLGLPKNMDNSLFYGDLATSKRVIYTPSKFAHSQLIHLQEIGELQAQKPHISQRENLSSFLFFIVTYTSHISYYFIVNDFRRNLK